MFFWDHVSIELFTIISSIIIITTIITITITITIIINIKSIIFSSNISTVSFIRICKCTCNMNDRGMNNSITIMALPWSRVQFCSYAAIIHIAAGRGCAGAVHAVIIIHVAGADIGPFFIGILYSY